MNTSLVKKTVFTAALALGLGVTASFAGGKAIKVGDTFPELAGFKLEGNLPDLKDKVVIVDFWAPWCGPCKESFPALEALHKKYADKGLVIVAVNVDEKEDAMKDFLKNNPVTFTIVRDATKKLVGTANIASMPSSFVIGVDGKVASVHKGFHGNETAKQYAQEVEGLLSRNVASK